MLSMTLTLDSQSSLSLSLFLHLITLHLSLGGTFPLSLSLVCSKRDKQLMASSTSTSRCPSLPAALYRFSMTANKLPAYVSGPGSILLLLFCASLSGSPTINAHIATSPHRRIAHRLIIMCRVHCICALICEEKKQLPRLSICPAHLFFLLCLRYSGIRFAGRLPLI